MKKAVVTHIYSDRNRGDAAITLATIQQLEERDYSVDLLSQYSFKDQRFHNDHQQFHQQGYPPHPALFPEPDIRRHQDFKKGNPLKKMVVFCYFLLKNQLYLLLHKISGKLPPLLMNAHERKSWLLMVSADVVVAKGGSYFYCLKSISSFFFYFRMLYILYFAKKVGKKVILFPQSMGPWELPPAVWLSRLVLKRMDAIIVREKRSEVFLHSQGIKNPRINVLADVALLWQESEAVDGFPSRLDSFNVGISARPYRFANNRARENYYQSMTAAIMTLKQRRNCRVFLFPQVTGPTDDEDDRPVLQQIYDGFPSDPAVVLLEGEYDARQLRFMYGKMDLMIATRLHAAIFAMSSDIPAIAISYHGTKTIGLYELMDLTEMGLDIETITPTQVQQVIQKVLPRLTQYSDKIRETRQEFTVLYNRILSQLL